MFHISDLQNNEGKVIEVNGKRIGIVKIDGKLKGLSLICKHRGCEVEWNGSDKTWDCPCHGSRYELDGSLKRGPAESDLDSIVIKARNNQVEF